MSPELFVLPPGTPVLPRTPLRSLRGQAPCFVPVLKKTLGVSGRFGWLPCQVSSQQRDSTRELPATWPRRLHWESQTRGLSPVPRPRLTPGVAPAFESAAERVGRARAREAVECKGGCESGARCRLRAASLGRWARIGRTDRRARCSGGPGTHPLPASPRARGTVPGVWWRRHRHSGRAAQPP